MTKNTKPIIKAKNMKNSYKAILLAALGLAAASATQAQTVYLGLNDLGNASSDYIISLGNVSQFTTTSSQTWTISPSLFSSAFGGDANALNDVAVGLAGGGQVSASSSTYVQTGNTALLSSGTFGSAVSDASSVGLDAGLVVSSSDANSWSTWVAQSPTVGGSHSGGSVTTASGNPMGTLSSGTLSTAVFEATLGTGRGGTFSAPVDIGTLVINANSGVDTITFTGSAVAVPEPGTYGLLAGAGLLLVGVRRQFINKKA